MRRAALAVLVLAVGLLAPSHAHAGQRPVPPDVAEPEPESWIEDRLRQLDGDLERALRRVDPALDRGAVRAVGPGRDGLARKVDSVLADWRSRRSGDAGPPTGTGSPVPEPVVAALHRIARALYGLPRTGPGGDGRTEGSAEALRAGLRELDGRVGELGRLAEKYRPGRQPAPAARPIERSVAPVNDDCASATPVGEGTFMGTTDGATNDGSATCGATLGSPDVWFLYTASADAEVVFDTFGSEYDTVLSLHSGCPGTTSNQLQCNDDFGGLQSQVSLAVTAGEQVWVRVSGYSGATGSFILTVQQGGRMSGTVTEASTSNPLAGVEVDFFDGTGSFVTWTMTAGDGTFTSPIIAPGLYHATTFEPGYVDELYDDLPCVGSCDVTNGTPIAVNAGSETPGIDFVLDPGGSISGTLTDAASADPLEGEVVWVYDGSFNFRGSASSAADGGYTVGGLPPGIYHARTFSSSHVDELYDDLPCAFGCDVTAGTPISVAASSDTPGVDFALVLGGSIAGTVTEAPTATPLAGRSVRIYDGGGTWRRSAFTAGDGTYAAGGLPAGSYFARVTSPLHVDEVYDDVPCHPDCDPTGGTSIPVTTGAQTSGIDFVLVRLGWIAGAVTEAGTGTPLAGVPVSAYDGLGRLVAATASLGDGTYVLGGFPPGDYRVLAGPTSSHAAQAFERLPFGLDPLSGAAVSVSPSVTTAGVDFPLWPLGACGFPASLHLSSVTVASVAEYAACGDLTAGPQLEVEGTGAAALRAGGTVALDQDVAVRAGGRLVIASGSILPPPTGDVVYGESFDDGFALGWDTSNGGGGLWRVDSGCTAEPSGPGALAFSRPAPDCDYDLGDQVAAGWARSPILDISAASTAWLQFEHLWETEGGGTYDRLSVEVSSDGGASWTEIWTRGSASSSGSYVLEALNVTAYASSQFRFRFVFDSVDSLLNEYAGWYVDDVVVTAP